MGDVPGATTFHKPAEAYDRLVGRYSHELARAVIDAAGVRPGARALDVGCGPGALTSELAAVLGADRVAAVDPSPPFVEACRQRVPGVEVEAASAEALPFDDAAFDHALCQLVVNFMTDAPAGVREMQRVTRPGGTVSAAVWDYAGEMTLLRRFWDAVVALDPAAEERDEGRRMAFCSAEELGDLWSTVGLAEVAVAAGRRERRLRRLRGPLGPAGAGRRALGGLRGRAGARAPGGAEGGVPAAPGRRRRTVPADRARVARDRPGPLTSASAAVPGAAAGGRRAAALPSPATAGATPPAGCSG